MAYAATHNDPEVLEIVLTAGLDPTMRQSESGFTVLMHASQSKTDATARMRRLANLGVDPLAVSGDGFSALDFAIAVNNRDAIEQMLVWIEAALPESIHLVTMSISIAERVDELDPEELRSWLAAKTNNTE